MTGEPTNRFELMQSALTVISTLEENIDDDSLHSQLEEARNYIAQASRHVGTAVFENKFSKAIGMASSVAITTGHDELAAEALNLGGEENEQ